MMAGGRVVNNHPKTLKIRTSEQFAKAIEDITENMSTSAQPESMALQELLLLTELMGGTLLNMADQQNSTKMRNKA